MKLNLLIIYLITSSIGYAQRATETMQSLPFGSVRPAGWLKEQMKRDVNGFVGHLDMLVPDLINDPIYSTGRLQKNSKAKDLGNQKEGDAAGEDQYKWWNSETQSNWWDGYIRNVFLINDKTGMEKVTQYIERVLATQDEDGYLGIYDRELRYNFNSENGELWSKATLYRGLFAYYECTNDEKVFMAIKKAVENVMQNYPMYTSSPFSSGTGFNGGVSHGLTFTDVLDRMYFHSKDKKYLEYALFLYMDFSKTYQTEEDAQLRNILSPNYKLKSHGVHTYEHLRPLIVAKYAAQNADLSQALDIYLKRIEQVTTITGGAIGDEWIAGRTADATHTGYEYCSLQELMDSYALMLQKTGASKWGDEMENIFYNAAQGARNPHHSSIAYLKTDNSFEMMGTKNGEIEPDRKQTRYKYSPAHQDVAVCCSPNAGRITPYFVQNSWMKENDNTLVATLFMPNVLETTISGSKIRLENHTDYPNENSFKFIIQIERPTHFKLKIRKPKWVTSIKTKVHYSIENDYLVIEKTFSNETIHLDFTADVVIKIDKNNEKYFSYGPLVYAKPIQAKEILGKVYAEKNTDITYEPISLTKYLYAKGQKANFKNGVITVGLINQKSNQTEQVALVPIGKTILRQATFK